MSDLGQSSGVPTAATTGSRGGQQPLTHSSVYLLILAVYPYECYSAILHANSRTGGGDIMMIITLPSCQLIDGRLLRTINRNGNNTAYEYAVLLDPMTPPEIQVSSSVAHLTGGCNVTHPRRAVELGRASAMGRRAGGSRVVTAGLLMLCAENWYVQPAGNCLINTPCDNYW